MGDSSLWLYWAYSASPYQSLICAKKGTGTSTNDDDNDELGDTEQLDDTVDYDEEELVEAINESNKTDNKSSVKHVSRVVGCFRTVTT